MLRHFVFRFSSLLKIPEVPNVPAESLPRAKVVLKRDLVLEESIIRDVWLSKKIADIGICSRPQAERFISCGMITCDGQIAWRDTKIKEDSVVTFHHRKDLNTRNLPLSEHLKV